MGRREGKGKVRSGEEKGTGRGGTKIGRDKGKSCKEGRWGGRRE